MTTIVNDLGRWRVNCVPTVSDGKNTEVYGKWIVGDGATSGLGELDEDTYTEWGEPMRRRVVTGIVASDRKWHTVQALELDGETNAGGWVPDPDDIVEASILVDLPGGFTLDGASCDLGTSGEFDITDTTYSTTNKLSGVKIGITKIDDTEDYSGVVFTVTGTDREGASATENMTGLTVGTVLESDTYWSAITEIGTTEASTSALTNNDTVSIGIVAPGMVSMEVSRDGQRSWSTARYRTFDVFSRIRWNKVGAGRQSVFRFTCDEAVKFVVNALHGMVRGRAS